MVESWKVVRLGEGRCGNWEEVGIKIKLEAEGLNVRGELFGGAELGDAGVIHGAK